MSPENRRGYEFSRRIKHAVRRRAHNRCEAQFAPECSPRVTVDHITHIKIAPIIGMSREVTRSIQNAQLICDNCDDIKHAQEMLSVRAFERQLNDTFTSVEVEWSQMRKTPKEARWMYLVA